MFLEDVLQLTATVLPTDCIRPVIWSASNSNCTVNNGLVTAVGVVGSSPIAYSFSFIFIISGGCNSCEIQKVCVSKSCSNYESGRRMANIVNLMLL